MLTPIANVHRSKLPQPGEIVYLIRGQDRWGAPVFLYGRRERFIVESYPLTNAADPRYSRGIHLVWLRSLRDGHEAYVSGFYCVPCDEV